MGNKDSDSKNQEPENWIEGKDNFDNLLSDDRNIEFEDLAPAISKKLNLPEKEIRSLLRNFEKELAKALTFGSIVKIDGFGTFYPEGKMRKRRKKGSEQEPGKKEKGVVFVPAKEVTERLNFLYAESLKKQDKTEESQQLKREK